MTCFVVAAPVSGSSSAETAFALSSDAGSFGRYPSVTFQFNVNPYGSLGYSGQVTLACVNTSSEFACWGYDGGIDGALHCWSCSIDTTDSYMLRDGVDITYPGAGQPYSGTMTRPEQQFFIGAHPSFDGARPMTSPLYMVAIVPRKMAKAEAARISQLLLRNLGVGFSKRPKRVFVSAGGGASSYDVNLTEAASAADSPSAAAVRSASASEAASAGDVTAALLAAVGAVTEAATAAESASSGAATSSAITEAASASDAPAASSVRVGAIAESATASDVVAALATMQSAVGEATSAGDLAAGVLIAVAAVAEAVSTADAATTGPQYDLALEEAASAADALQAAAQLVASLTEAASAGAAFSAAASLVAAITEAANAGDSVSGGATVYSVSLTELAAAVDVLAASLAGDAGMLDNVRTIRGSARDVIRAAARNIIRGYRPS